jgi:hypothetical protein
MIRQNAYPVRGSMSEHSRLLENRAEHHVYREASPSNNTHKPGHLLAIKQLECMRYDSEKCLPW